MTMQASGPGGVSNNYGSRSSNQPSQISSEKPKDVYNEFSAGPGAYYSTDANNNVTGLVGPGGSTYPIGNQGFQTNLMVSLGDSITWRVGDDSTSPTVLMQSTSFLGWANSYMGGAFTFLNYGVSGNKTSDILARLPAALSASNGGWLHLLAGGNDITADVSAATIISNLSSIISQAINNRFKVIVGTIYPFTTVNTSARKSVLAQVNNYIRGLQNANRQVTVADYYYAMVDSAGALRANYSLDGTHPAPLGASIMGRVLQSAVGSLVSGNTTVLSSSDLDGYNCLPNGQLAGNNASGSNNYTAGTGFTGNGPRGWSWARTGSGITATVSKQARSLLTNATDLTRAQITVTGADNDVARLERVFSYRLWSSGGTSNSARRFYVPSTGAQYDVITDGTFAVGSDPTAGWATTPGAIITDGSTTLICVNPISAGMYVQAAAECFISSISVGQVQPTLNFSLLNTASSVLATGAALYFNGVAGSGVMAGAAETGNTNGLTLLTAKVQVPVGFDLANTTTSAGPTIRVRCELAVANSALATVDWGRVTLRATTT